MTNSMPNSFKIIEVTDCQPSYVAAISRLLTQLSHHSATFSSEQLRTMVDCPNCHLFLLLEDRDIAGMASLGTYVTPTGRKWWIEDLVVDSAFRGKKYGNALVEHVQEFVQTQGGGTLFLTSRPERVAANLLYQSLGFIPKETNVYKKEF